MTSPTRTQLKDVVVNQVEMVVAQGSYKHTGTETYIWAVVGPNATPLWKNVVSKGDVFVHVRRESVTTAGHIACCTLGWCWDGPNDACCLLPLDNIGHINEQVVVLHRDTTVLIASDSF